MPPGGIEPGDYPITSRALATELSRIKVVEICINLLTYFATTLVTCHFFIWFLNAVVDLASKSIWHHVPN